VYAAADLVNELRAMTVRHHVAQKTSAALDDRPSGGLCSLRKRIEKAFGWMKSVAGMLRPILRGVDRAGWVFTFAAAACNLICLPRLLTETG
jgi:hypothetical protein